MFDYILYLFVAYGIRCYTCTRAKLQSCNGTINCTREFDQCFSVENDEGKSESSAPNVAAPGYQNMF